MMGGKAEPFSWRSVEDDLAVKYLENLDVYKICAILNDVKYSICSSLDFENRLWVIIFTEERALRQAFTYLKWTKETQKKWKLFNVNIKNTRMAFYSFNC